MSVLVNRGVRSSGRSYWFSLQAEKVKAQVLQAGGQVLSPACLQATVDLFYPPAP